MRQNRTLIDPAAALGVAQGSNRINSSGSFALSAKSRSTQRITQVVAAGKTLPLPVSGTFFYLIIATGALQIRPSNGSFAEYNQGQGLDVIVENAFDLIEVRNTNSFPVVFSLFVGFDSFIDKTLVMTNTGIYPVTKPTYPVANAAIVVNIPDISGEEFTDINGNQWIALQRQTINITNSDTGVTLSLLLAAATGPSDPAVIQIFPQTVIAYPSQGNFRITTGGGTINAIVSEIYSAVRKTT